ncbi:SusC/RagA family TonB-linked outer membrane protein [Pedobacter yulinensis]|uniref:SusC/RagA family TonB-linked outer membrane protein n=2 Tax=Pedobacter yulinensis TaxID=2126353 RepID=A0A2T3HN46_9SPHI|nr:SusC/RagA family TonB-linked outer membrane protein [Pedobacter yulinensis]
MDYTQQGNTIVVFKKADDAKREQSSVQQKSIRGKVTDRRGEPLEGVSVKVKGGNASASTKNDGSYTIEAADGNAILVFSYVGYLTEEVAAAGKSRIDLQLRETATDLNEVLVIGYGSVRKKDLTGAVGDVNVAQLAKAPVASFDQALAGRIAGVQVSSMEDGQPGSGMNIVIRGSNSLTQSNAPLYVVDGFPMENLQTAGINPDDIQSINILKDASATAIYGARAANGVIVIETKKGKTGKPVISLNASLGTETTPKMMDLLDPHEFVKYEFERYGTGPDQLGYFLNGKTVDSYRETPGIDWQRELFRTGLTQIHNVAMRGGTDQTKYAISGSVYNSDGVVANSGFDRYQARISVDQTVSKKLKTGINVNFSNQLTYGQVLGRTSATSSTTISGFLLYSVWGYRPVTGSEADNLSLEDQLLDSGVDPASDFRINPIISAENTLRQRKINNLTANAYAAYDFTKHLTLKITGGLNGYISRNEEFYNSKTVRGTPLRVNNINGINGSVNNGQHLDWLNENTLTWSKSLGGGHRLEALGGVTLQGARNTANGFSAILVPNESLGIAGLSQGTPLETISNASENRMASFISRVNYNYKSRYLLTATMRADGSSKFSPGRRWGYFPSAAFAWRMSQESFLKKIPAISDAKLRVSYGVTGNNRVSDFAYLAAIDLNDLASYSFNNQRLYGLNITRLGNPELRWESTAQVDAGYDLSLFKDRVSLVVDWYRKTTYDLLLNAQLPYTTGFSNSFKNIGKIRNEGWEFTLNTINVHTPKFSWESNFNISFNRNKIMSLAENQPNLLSNIRSFVSRMAEEPLYIAEIGKPAAMFYGLIWDGVYQYADFDQPSPGVYVLKNSVPTNGDIRSAIKPGDIRYRDINNDGVIDGGDKTVIGNAIPVHVGGFSNSFSYKGFELSVLLQWSYGNKIMNANRLIFEGNITEVPHFNQFASWADRWTPENQTNELFRAGGGGPQVMSSRTLEDGSYLRLKTVALSYSLPAAFIRRARIRSLSLNVAAQNLHTWTNYSGMDPEVSVQNSTLTPGFDFSAYPHSRTLVFGLKAAF